MAKNNYDFPITPEDEEMNKMLNSMGDIKSIEKQSEEGAFQEYAVEQSAHDKIFGLPHFREIIQKLSAEKPTMEGALQSAKFFIEQGFLDGRLSLGEIYSIFQDDKEKLKLENRINEFFYNINLNIDDEEKASSVKLSELSTQVFKGIESMASYFIVWADTHEWLNPEYLTLQQFIERADKFVESVGDLESRAETLKSRDDKRVAK
jgi:hypothetical protein